MSRLSPAMRAGLAAAALPVIILLLNGVWSGLLMSLIAGAGAGLLAASWEEWDSPGGAVRVGLRGGLAAGGALLVAQLFRDRVLVTLAALPPVPAQQTLLASLGALVIGAASGLVFARAQALPGRRATWATYVLLGLIAVLYPLIDQAIKLGWIGEMIAILIFVLLGLGLNIVVGYAGLLDLGYAAFFAIGAYATGLLSSPQLGVQVNFWVVIWVAAGVAALFGMILGAPTLPLRGDYLAIVTLGFGEIVPIVFRNLTAVVVREPFTGVCLVGCDKPLNLTGGVTGINPIGRPALPVLDPATASAADASTVVRLILLIVLLAIGAAIFWGLAYHAAGTRTRPLAFAGFGAYALLLLYFFFALRIGEFQPGRYLPWYYLILSLIVFSVFFIDRLHHSRLGRAWTAIREDELAAAAMGINLVRTKLLAFAMGATFSGFAGAFFAAYISAIFPTTFDFSISVIVLCMVILGGLGNMAGVILGGLIIIGADRIFLPQFAQLAQAVLKTSVFPLVANPALRDSLVAAFDPSQLRLLLFGLTLVIMMIVRPEGLVPSARRRVELHERPALGEAGEQPPAPSEVASPGVAIVAE